MENGAIRLSVVVPYFNAAATIGQQLEALCRQSWDKPWEVIAVDNRSTDGSALIVEAFTKRMPNLRLVEAAAKQGQPYAMNVGVAAANGTALAFCDADDVVGEGWVAAMGEALALHPFVSGPFETERLNGGGLAVNRRNPQPDGIQSYRYPPYLPHAGSGNMGVRRSIFEAVGGFDESLPALFDTDFCWRVQRAGHPLQPVSGAVLHVRFRESVAGLARQARRYGQYNVLLYKRYRPFGMPRLPLRWGVRGWIELLGAGYELLDRKRRGRWLWRLNFKLGRLYGSIKYRTLAI